MKKCNSKKLTAAWLCTLLLASCVISCGDSGNADGSPDDSNAAQTEATTAADPIKEQLELYDFGGEEFRIFGEDLYDYLDREQTGEAIDDAVYKRNMKVEELYNLDLQYEMVNVSENNTNEMILNMAMSGDTSYALYIVRHLYLGSYLGSNVVADWNAVEDHLSLDAPWYNQNANNTYSIGDTMMLLLGELSDSMRRLAWCFVFNKTLCAQYDIPNLYEVVDTGKWTIDYLQSLTKDIYSDLNGDGKYDEEDLYGFVTDKHAAVDAFVKTCGLEAIAKDERNYPYLDFWDENTVNAFEKIYSLWYDYSGTYVSESAHVHVNTHFAENRALISLCMLLMLENEEIRNMDDFGVLPFPKMTEAQEMGYTHTDGVFSAQLLPFTLSMEELIQTAIVTDALNAYSYEYVRPAYYDTVLKTKLTRDEDSVRMLDLVMEGRRFSFDSLDEVAFPLSPNTALRQLIGTGKKKDIASYYERSAKKAQKWVDKIIEAYEKAQED